LQYPNATPTSRLCWHIGNVLHVAGRGLPVVCGVRRCRSNTRARPLTSTARHVMPVRVGGLIRVGHEAIELS
jgi:hypothetical protein